MRILVPSLLAVVCQPGHAQEQRDGEQFENAVLGGFSRFGSPSGSTDFFARSLRSQDDGEWNAIWEETGTVPEKVPQLPEGRAYVRYPSGVTVRPNDTLTSGLMLQFPEITWDADPSSLYTVMIVDIDIFQPNNPVTNFIHYMATNVPGGDIDRGVENFEYIPPFAFLYEPSQGLVNDPTFTHRMAYLVFRQSGPIDAPVEEQFCSPKVFERLMNYSTLVSKYNLGNAMAGNFLLAPYSQGTTDQFLCVFSRCTEHPFPAPLPGINDGPECTP